MEYKSKYNEFKDKVFTVYAKRSHSNDYISSYETRTNAQDVADFLNGKMKVEVSEVGTKKYYIGEES